MDRGCFHVVAIVNAAVTTGVLMFFRISAVGTFGSVLFILKQVLIKTKCRCPSISHFWTIHWILMLCKNDFVFIDSKKQVLSYLNRFFFKCGNVLWYIPQLYGTGNGSLRRLPSPLATTHGCQEHYFPYYCDSATSHPPQSHACWEPLLRLRFRVTETNSSKKRTFIVRIKGDWQTLRARVRPGPQRLEPGIKTLAVSASVVLLGVITATVLAMPRDGLASPDSWERASDGVLEGQCPSAGSEVRVTVHREWGLFPKVSGVCMWQEAGPRTLRDIRSDLSSQLIYYHHRILN